MPGAAQLHGCGLIMWCVGALPPSPAPLPNPPTSSSHPLQTPIPPFFPRKADYPTDVAVLTVSRGRSLLRDAHHLVLPLAPPPAAALGPVILDPSELEAVRDYLSFVRGLQCQLDELVAEQLAGAFVEAARGEPGFNMDRFNTCVTVGGGGAAMATALWRRLAVVMAVWRGAGGGGWMGVGGRPHTLPSIRAKGYLGVRFCCPPMLPGPLHTIPTYQLQFPLSPSTPPTMKSSP